MGESSSMKEQSTKGVAETSTDPKINVYVWDMDETLILLSSLLNGTYAESFSGSKNVREGVEIGKMWENYILDLCDDSFFYDEIQNFNEPFLSSLDEYDDKRDLSMYDFSQDGFRPPFDDGNKDEIKRKLAYRHRVIAQKYKEGLNKVFDPKMMKRWEELYSLTDSYTDGWFSAARAFLEECSVGKNGTSAIRSDGIVDPVASKSQNVNVLVTYGSLIPSLVKCLLFRFDDLLPQENVYSSPEVGKLQCFRWIKGRFNGPNVRFCVIGDGYEECEAAEFMRWPFIKIDFRPNCTPRFPGLTLKTLGYYLAVVYGDSEPEVS